MDDFIPNGSGVVTIRILDSDGNLVSTSYKNLSDFAVVEEKDGNTELQTSH